MHIYSEGISEDTKRKALFVIASKGTSLSKMVKDILEKNAKEFEKLIKE
jgi:hypothetical protein